MLKLSLCKETLVNINLGLTAVQAGQGACPQEERPTSFLHDCGCFEKNPAERPTSFHKFCTCY